MIIVISFFLAIDVISVWLQLCYKTSMYCVVSALLIQGWHRSTVDVIHSGQVATEMVSEHTLTVGHDH